MSCPHRVDSSIKINSNEDDEKAKGNHQFDHWLV